MNMDLIRERLQDRDIQLELDASAIDFVLQQAYDSMYGARPLRRYLEKHLVTMLSKGLFAQKIPNHSRLRIVADQQYNKLGFIVTKVAAADQQSQGQSSSQKMGQHLQLDGAMMDDDNLY
jgi:ATP-dependent Clp protease ATP-binding subunit ClpA